MGRTCEILRPFDDHIFIGWNDGRVQCMPKDVFLQVMDGEVPIAAFRNYEDGPLPRQIDWDGEEVTLMEYYSPGCQHTVIAAFNRETRLWLVEKEKIIRY